MLVPEARWFGHQLALYRNDELEPLLNLGSQSVMFRTRVQPWVDRFVFAPARQRQLRVIHSDLLADEGIDLVGDLTDPAFLAHLKTLRFRSVICSNLLEHVVNPGQIAATVAEIVEPRGLLFLSVPYRFPYHADPIDTMFRPDPSELAALVPGMRVVEQQILRGGNLTTYALGRLFGSPRRFVRDVFRKKTGVRKLKSRSWSRETGGHASPDAPRSSLLLLPWFVRRFQISCLVLRKDKA